MNWEAVISGTSLAMDSVAMSACIGAAAHGSPWPAAWRLGLSCGLFQFLMPLAGWLLGDLSARWISALDHWVAFVLLAFVGGGMLRDFFFGGDKEPQDVTRSLGFLLTVALATSIDALTVGAGFGLAGLGVMELAVFAGVVTGLGSIAGAYLGRAIGAGFGRKMELVGGVLLILIGLNILVTHLMGGEETVVARLVADLMC